MDKWQRRTAYYVAGLAAVIAGYTAVYHYGMRTFEGASPAPLHSLQVVVETFTTTGFGSDAPWASPEMNLIVVLMDLTGVALIFMALPVLVFPLFEDALSTTVPSAVDGDLADHVVVCTHTPRSELLVEELDARGVDHVVVEPDRETAAERYEAGESVVHADPEAVEGLAGACVEDAQAVVADVSDRVDASIVLTARELTAETRVISVVEDPETARYHRLAGADTVLSPRELIGESLATKVTAAVTTDVDAVDVGTDLEIAELSVRRGSELVGSTVGDSGIRERTGANVIGAWFGGEFESPPDPGAALTPGTVLLVSGRGSQLAALKSLTRSEPRAPGTGETVVAGFGEVGQTVVGALEDGGVPHAVLDRESRPDVDVVGDATDPDALREAGVTDARSVVLALGDDTTTEFATLVVRDLAPDVEIVARVEETENVPKLYRAGADYVLSLAMISGRMIASTIVTGEDVLSLDTQVEVVQLPAGGLVGRTLGEADVRSRTGCTVIGAERDGEVVTDLGPGFRIHDGDELVVAGTTEGISQFRDLVD